MPRWKVPMLRWKMTTCRACATNREGAHDDAQEDEGADMDEENEDEATMEVEDDGSDKQEL